MDGEYGWSSGRKGMRVRMTKGGEGGCMRMDGTRGKRERERRVAMKEVNI